MNSKGLLACVLLAGFVAGSAAADAPAPESSTRQAIRNLGWVKGPTSVPLFGSVASLKVPAGYRFLNQDDTRKFMTLNENLSNGKEYLLAPDDLHWFGVLEFSDDGYVKDDEKIDAASLLDSIREGTAESNKERRKKGWDEMTIVGWKVPPHYDSATKRLEWAILGKSSSSDSSVINFNTRVLGRAGVTSAVLVADPDALDAAVAEFKTTLEGYDYATGQRYSEYTSGDKIAEYGLAALVLGGAAAVATKTGFWKTLAVALAAGWKFIAAGVAALAAWGSKLLKGRKS